MPRLLAFLVAALFSFGAAAQAEASCAASPLEGTWVIETADTRAVTRLTVDHTCSEPAATVQLWGHCAPADCDWGRLPAAHMKSGWTYSFKDDGIAQRHIFVRLAESDRLHVYIKTDFSDPARPDYDQDAIFVKF